MSGKLAGAHKKILISTVVFIAALGMILYFSYRSPGEETPQGGSSYESANPPKKMWRILHLMSYHSPWKWTDNQFQGFKDALKGLDVEYRVFQMDTKRKSVGEWKEKVGREARDLIGTWKPDLVYANDDNAQRYVTKYYINGDIPFVFSGVNGDPEDYGFDGSTNIAGVLEREHFVGTVRLLREIVPDVKKIAVIIDDGPTWGGVVKRMKEKAPVQLPDTEFIAWDIIHTFEQYMEKIRGYQTEADAIALLGIFTYKDENGNNVPYREVLRWTAENSDLPDFSFWKDRISYGTLCTVTVSGYSQGLAAGRIARAILVDGRSPSSFPFESTVKGEPVVSLARAKKLGIDIKSGVLLTAEVVKEFAWER
jgi:ABC-type uncharacterized transport system substrate-binding protein